MDISLIISLISAVTALSAVILGPFISLRIAKQQTVSPMRQQWINDLRTKITELISISRNYYVAGIDAEDDTKAYSKAEYELERKKMFLYHEIELMLNPLEEEHQKLLNFLNKISFSIDQKDIQLNFPTIMPEGIKLIQNILKNEWIRVKR